MRITQLDINIPTFLDSVKKKKNRVEQPQLQTRKGFSLKREDGCGRARWGHDQKRFWANEREMGH